MYKIQRCDSIPIHYRSIWGNIDILDLKSIKVEQLLI